MDRTENGILLGALPSRAMKSSSSDSAGAVCAGMFACWGWWFGAADAVAVFCCLGCGVFVCCCLPGGAAVVMAKHIRIMPRMRSSRRK